MTQVEKKMAAKPSASLKEGNSGYSMYLPLNRDNFGEGLHPGTSLGYAQSLVGNRNLVVEPNVQISGLASLETILVEIPATATEQL